ncbi:MAG TPA: zinc-ribbon domain-containing protein [Terriglobales bacterium]|nr:zinc-ribbon domain-containing protein [Terriglobales bacterium]
MARFCSSCGASVADNANNCAKCGAAVSVGGGAAAAPAVASAGGLADNIAGLLCYVPFFIGIIASILFLVLEPYNRNKFVRFHAFQSLLTHVAVVVIFIALGIVGAIMGSIMPFLALILLPVEGLLSLACLCLVLLLMYKAYQNEMFELPVVGPIAAKQAGA